MTEPFIGTQAVSIGYLAIFGRNYCFRLRFPPAIRRTPLRAPVLFCCHRLLPHLFPALFQAVYAPLELRVV
jgi:hypothetical protein